MQCLAWFRMVREAGPSRRQASSSAVFGKRALGAMVGQGCSWQRCWEATVRREGAAVSPQVRPWAGMESGGLSDRGQGWDSWTGDQLQVKDEEEEHDLAFLGM